MGFEPAPGRPLGLLLLFDSGGPLNGSPPAPPPRSNDLPSTFGLNVHVKLKTNEYLPAFSFIHAPIFLHPLTTVFPWGVIAFSLSRT